MVNSYQVPSFHSSSSVFPIGSPSPDSSSSWFPFTLTQNDINAFHNIDRQLYSRLVIDLRRHPMGSMHVMALWIWLERSGHQKGNLVNLMLGFKDDAISVLADEADMCLMCADCDDYLPENDRRHIPMTQSLTGAALSLRYFHQNRARIIPEVNKIMTDVCIKAFSDIMQEAMRLQANSNPPNNQNFYFANADPARASFFHVPNPNPHPLGGFYVPNPQGPPLLVTPMPPNYNRPMVTVPSPFTCFSNPTMPPAPIADGSASSSSSNVRQFCAPPFIKEGGYLDLLTRPSHEFEVKDHREFLNNELTEVLNRLQIEVYGAGDVNQAMAPHQEVPPDERTVFLTFSKGYPLTEIEVLDFFTRKYGNCFEAVHMQEVTAPRAQPLYARLVLRPDSSTDVVLNGKTRAKFSINGKHVWARKFVRKNPNKSLSAPSPSLSPSQSPASSSQMISDPPHPYGHIQFGTL